MGSDPSPSSAPLRRTPLYDIHVAAGAKMVPFAGYEMPVNYPLGVLKEHLWTREKAGLFDVSHMGQAFLVAADQEFETSADFLELLCPADVRGLKLGQQRYSQLLDSDGGIIDDFMMCRLPFAAADGGLFLVFNADRKSTDIAHIYRLGEFHTKVLLVESDRALLALQGPAAEAVMREMSAEVAALRFMEATTVDLGGITCHVSRSGYTGEDGFEISVATAAAADLWQKLSADARVAPIGLGARDSLRLEAGLCLYGHDIDTTTTPIEASLAWSIQKRRRERGGFPGELRILAELRDGPRRRRVGIKPEGRAPAREGTEIQSLSGEPIGTITSGGFGPSLNAPVAMGYVAAPHAAIGTKVQLVVRGKPMPAEIAAMPFVPHRYARK